MKFRKRESGKPRRKPCIASLHHKNTRPRIQPYLRILRRKPSRQIVPGVPVSEKMRIESDDHRVARRCDLRKQPDHVLEFRFKMAHRSIRAIHRSEQKNQAIGRHRSHHPRSAKPRRRIPFGSSQTKPRENRRRDHQQVSAVDEQQEDQREEQQSRRHPHPDEYLRPPRDRASPAECPPAQRIRNTAGRSRQSRSAAPATPRDSN